MKNNADFDATLQDYRHRLDQTLTAAVIRATEPKSHLRETMLYAIQNGGKRLRPVFVYTVGQTFGLSLAALDPIAAAVESIHTYSLIHDDLPAMDDDILRRGKPTCHIAFGEAAAILAGDAFNTLAFDLLSTENNHALPAERSLQLVQLLATHAGGIGMIGGQSLDILAEGKTISLAELEHIHQLKTGALIKASILMGAIAAGCQPAILSKLAQFAEHIGLAFQLQDDLLDITGSSKKLGKHTQQDAKQHKATYAILFGIEETRVKINALISSAISILDALDVDTGFLGQLCLYLLARDR